MTDKPPFVASQRLLLLDAGVDDPHRYLKPALFRPGGDGDAESRPRHGPDGHEEDPGGPSPGTNCSSATRPAGCA